MGAFILSTLALVGLATARIVGITAPQIVAPNSDIIITLVTDPDTSVTDRLGNVSLVDGAGSNMLFDVWNKHSPITPYTRDMAIQNRAPASFESVSTITAVIESVFGHWEDVITLQCNVSITRGNETSSDLGMGICHPVNHCEGVLSGQHGLGATKTPLASSSSTPERSIKHGPMTSTSTASTMSKHWTKTFTTTSLSTASSLSKQVSDMPTRTITLTTSTGCKHKDHGATEIMIVSASSTAERTLPSMTSLSARRSIAAHHSTNSSAHSVLQHLNTTLITSRRPANASATYSSATPVTVPTLHPGSDLGCPPSLMQSLAASGLGRANALIASISQGKHQPGKQIMKELKGILADAHTACHSNASPVSPSGTPDDGDNDDDEGEGDDDDSEFHANEILRTAKIAATSLEAVAKECDDNKAAQVMCGLLSVVEGLEKFAPGSSTHVSRTDVRHASRTSHIPLSR